MARIRWAVDSIRDALSEQSWSRAYACSMGGSVVFMRVCKSSRGGGQPSREPIGDVLQGARIACRLRRSPILGILHDIYSH